MISDTEKNRGRRIKVLGIGGVASLSRWHLHRNLPRESMSVNHWRKECQGEGTAHVGALGGRGACALGSRHSKEGARGGPGLRDKQGVRGSHRNRSLWLLP